MNVTLQIKRISSNRTDYIPQLGELVYYENEIGKYELKIGNGVTSVGELPPIINKNNIISSNSTDTPLFFYGEEAPVNPSEGMLWFRPVDVTTFGSSVGGDGEEQTSYWNIYSGGVSE